MFEGANSCKLYSFKKNIPLLNSTKQTQTSPLYVAGQSFGFEQMLQHCLWKVLSETGFVHNDQLTEMESVVLSKLLRQKYTTSNHTLPGDTQYGMAVLNSAIDKIVCQIKTLQIENQKYHSVIAQNRHLKNGLSSLIRISEQGNNSSLPLKIERSINDVGLSKRAVRLLQSLGVDTLEKLRSCSLARLRNQGRIGVKTIHDIETILSKYPVQASPDR